MVGISVAACAAYMLLDVAPAPPPASTLEAYVESAIAAATDLVAQAKAAVGA